MKKVTGALIALIFLLSQASPLLADSSGEMMVMLQSMKQQMNQMQETINQQNLRIQELESRKPVEISGPSAPAQPVQLSKADWQKGIKDNIGEAVPWMKGAKYSGDFRLRYEAFQFKDNNSDENIASDRTRNRFRIRLRWGFEKDYGDDWKVGFRLASAVASSGQATDNTSTTTTLGNPGYFTFKDIFIDRAYAQYSPGNLKDNGPIKGVTIGAGKFDNPFFRYSTPIVWDSDLTPEGIYEKANFQLYNGEKNKLNLYTTLGQFITNENSGTDADAGIYGYQGALNWSTHHFNTKQPVDVTGAVSFYDVTDWSNTVLASGNTASTSFLRTNTLEAGGFRMVDVYPEVQFYIGDNQATLWYNYVNNVGNDRNFTSGTAAGDDIHDMDTAWGLGAKFGKAKKKGDWEAYYGYYEIGANAVVAAFNDNDFGGPGGAGHTNRQGHKFGVGYSLTDSIMVNWTGYVVTPLNPNTSTTPVANSLNETVFRSQADLNYKF